MKRKIAKAACRMGLVFSILFAGSTQSIVRAELNGPFSTGFNLNVPIAVGDTSNVLKNGFGFGLDLGYRKETSPLGVRLDMIYDSFGLTSDVLNQIRRADSGWASTWGFDLSAVLAPPNAKKVRPYLQFGPGFYYEHAEANNFSGSGGTYCDPWFGCYYIGSNQTVEDWSTWRLGWMGGAGLNVEFDGGGAFFMQAQYHEINNANAKTEFVPISAGYRHSF